MTQEGRFETCLESDGDVITCGPNVNSVADDRVIEVGLIIPSTLDNPEVVLWSVHRLEGTKTCEAKIVLHVSG